MTKRLGRVSLTVAVGLLLLPLQHAGADEGSVEILTTIGVEETACVAEQEFLLCVEVREIAEDGSLRVDLATEASFPQASVYTEGIDIGWAINHSGTELLPGEVAMVEALRVSTLDLVTGEDIGDPIWTFTALVPGIEGATVLADNGLFFFDIIWRFLCNLPCTYWYETDKRRMLHCNDQYQWEQVEAARCQYFWAGGELWHAKGITRSRETAWQRIKPQFCVWILTENGVALHAEYVDGKLTWVRKTFHPCEWQDFRSHGSVVNRNGSMHYNGTQWETPAQVEAATGGPPLRVTIASVRGNTIRGTIWQWDSGSGKWKRHPDNRSSYTVGTGYSIGGVSMSFVAGVGETFQLQDASGNVYATARLPEG